MPKRKPDYVHPTPNQDGAPPPEPKKWNPFSLEDSRAIETAFQKLSEDESRTALEASAAEQSSGDLGIGVDPRSDQKPNRTVGGSREKRSSAVKVPVNEDYLFDVDVKRRELGPAYWVGPVYETRRGTWFDASSFKPCDENLATQLEEGYLRNQPWKHPPRGQRSSQAIVPSSGTAESPIDLTTSVASSKSGNVSQDPKLGRTKSSSGASLTQASDKAKDNAPGGAVQQTILTHRLFGSYMNHVATYHDSTTAWVLSDDFLSRMSSAMFQRFTGGAGTKYVRGYTEISKKKVPKDGKRPTTPTKKADPNEPNIVPKVSAKTEHELQEQRELESSESHRQSLENEQESRVKTLERQMSSLVSSAMSDDPNKQDEEERMREEKEIQDDYRDDCGDAQDREIEHLILVTHGIGQRLGARFESFNFLHDVNELRKTLKTVYNASPDLQALNSEVEKPQKNCRVQVLPICWRHLLDFPQQGVKHNRKEHDIADVATEEDDEYPNLEAITVEGVPALRNIVADLALDILLYQTPAYKDHIAKIVCRESNRILKLFRKRNPSFNGKVSFIGHSLGSAIMFDILSDQPGARPAMERSQRHTAAHEHDFKLNFDVEDFFCLGSPIGLFQMLKGRTIGGRRNPNKVTLDGFPDSLDDPFHDTQYSKLPAHVMTDSQREAMISSPKCRQLFNIFHPSDPIGYRLEPLISSAMSSLKPQVLPYTKKNFFGAPMGQGFTGIPARVGQSFTGFWSNFSSSLTSSFINRSLGITAEDAARLGAPAPAPVTQAKVQQNLGAGAGTNIVGGGVISTAPKSADDNAIGTEKRHSMPPGTAGERDHMEGQRPLTLIDSEMETLYAGFQKRRKSEQESDASVRDLGESPLWKEAEERGRKLKKEEAKVRALNSNGRVDYSIQE